MTVVLIGAFDATQAIKKITATFGSMASPAAKSNDVPRIELPHLSQVKPEVIVDPSTKGYGVVITSIDARPPDTVEGRRMELVQRVATSALANRLSENRDRSDVRRFGTAG